MTAQLVQQASFHKRASPNEREEQLRKVLSLYNSGVTGPTEISKAFGYTDRTWGYRALNELVKNGQLKKSAGTGRIVASEKVQSAKEWIAISRDGFLQIPEVKSWVEDMLTRSEGKSLKSWKRVAWALLTICDTLRVEPKRLISPMINPDTAKFMSPKETVEYWLRKFALERSKTPTTTIRSYVMAARSFAMHHGVAWPRGVSGIMSGKKGLNKYAHIKLSEEQIGRAPEVCEDPLLRDIFEFGIDNGSRRVALLSARVNDFEFYDDYAVVRVHEAKTEGHGTSDWTKYVMTPSAFKHIKERWERRKAEGKEYLFADGPISTFGHQMNVRIKELYRKLGVTDPYFYAHGIHALRHCAAQHWLRVTDYDYEFVASILGWKTSQILKDWYGEMPADVKMRKLRSAISKAGGVAA